MLRQQRQRNLAQMTPSGPLHRFRRVAGVWTCSVIINFWNVIGNVTIAESLLVKGRYRTNPHVVKTISSFFTGPLANL